MSTFLAIATVLVAVGWVVSLSSTLWRTHRTAREGRVAIATAIAVGVWGVIEVILAREGAFGAAGGGGVPSVGVNLVVALLAMGLALAASPSLRRLVSRQSAIIRVQGWRLAGLLLLAHTVLGHVPALFGLPAGLGDVLVGATAFGVARTADVVEGRSRVVLWNALGVLDLVVAVALGVTTNPGPTQVFHTVPTSVMLTTFPLALIPIFIVPQALALHAVSLWQLLRGTWSQDVRVRQGVARTVPSAA